MHLSHPKNLLLLLLRSLLKQEGREGPEGLDEVGEGNRLDGFGFFRDGNDETGFRLLGHAFEVDFLAGFLGLLFRFFIHHLAFNDFILALGRHDVFDADI